MDFVKAHGTGNDFVVVPDLDDRVELDAGLVRALCDRRFGLGADGVIRLGAGSDGAQVFMDYRNADGGVVEMCGNGVRVVAKHVVDHGLVTPDGATVRVGTRAGIKPVAVALGPSGDVESVTVDMGVPVLAPEDVPFAARRPGEPSEVIDVDGAAVELSAVSMGNPHAVIVVDDVDVAPVDRLGPRLEADDRFPEGVNVEFAQPMSPTALRLRVWERGVGETAACGTGACAAAVALQRLGHVGAEVDVQLPGGTLRVRHVPGGDDTVLMTGPAVEVARGTLSPTWLARARAQAPRR